MRAVFLDASTFSSSVTFEAIEKQVDSFITYPTTQSENIIKRCLDAELVITNKVVLTEPILQQLPKLQLICIAATGTNNVDLVAAKKLNIAVCNVAGYAKNSVAQYVFSQLLNYFQNITHHNKNVENGLWTKSDTFCVFGNDIHEIAGKTIGIIGYGALGQSVAQIASAFGMKVKIAERPGAKSIREGRETLESVVKTSDIISLHCPHTNETEQLVDKSFLSKMKKDAVLINTARGALVKNEDLITALKDNQIAHAILDVIDQEPPPEDHPLLKKNFENLTVTAHIAWASIEAQQELIRLLSQNIYAYKTGSTLNRV